MYAIIAGLPIVFCLITMSVFNWGAIKSLGGSLIITIIAAIFIWKLPVVDIISYSFLGFFETLNIILIILGAMLVLNILTKAGAMDTVINSFNNISKDKRIQLLLIGLIFNGFFSGIAAFATEVVLSSLILIALGFPSLIAAVISLAFNASFVSFGAVGIPTVLAIQLTESLVHGNPVLYANQVTTYIALLHWVGTMFLAISVMFFVIRICAKDKSWKHFFEIIPFTIFAILATMFPTYLVAKFLGPELPAIIGPLVGFIIVTLAIKLKFLVPKNNWDFQEKENWPAYWSANSSVTNNQIASENKEKIGFFKAWLPYLVISVILIITRIPILKLQALIQKPIIEINNLFGLDKINYSFKWLYSAGIFPFMFVFILCIFYYRLNFKQTKEVVLFTINKVKVAVIALIISIAMVQIMLHSDNNPVGLKGMLVVIAEALSKLKGIGLVIVSPIIGIIGAFVSGSNATSNILFSVVQFKSAEIIHIKEAILVALQTVGGAIGDTFSIKSVVIVTAMTGLTKQVGKVTKYTMSLALIYLIVVVITTFIILM